LLKMQFSKPIGIGLVMLVAQLTASAGELAVLRNGFTVRIERKEQSGNITRLYTREGFLDIPSSEIASFEPDDSPLDVPTAAPAPSTAPATANGAVPPGTGPASAGFGQVAPGSAPSAANSALGKLSRADLDQLIREASSRHRLDPDFVNSVIKAESNFETRAVSSKGAQGLMQLMPGTASLLGVTNPFDPQANVEGGTTYLSQLLDQYNNDAVKALAAYNAGSHRVDQYHGVPPYAETQAYVARIVRDYNAKKLAQRNAQSKPAAPLAQSKSHPPAKKTGKKAPSSAQPQEAGLHKTKKPA
jgi:soluble lytic murein transglycosylase-like protein